MPKNRQQSEEPASPAEPAAQQFRLSDLLLLIGAVAYFVTFYGRSAERWVGLQVRLSWLLVPDVPFNEWVGGDPASIGFLGRFWVVSAATVILLAAFALGTVILDALAALKGLTRLEASLFAVGVGLNLLSTVTLVIGMAGGYGQSIWFLSLLLAIVGLVVARRRAFERYFDGSTVTPNSPQDTFPSPRIGWIVGAPFALVILLGALLPPWHFDVREYHLQVPREWFQAGGVTFMPHNVYGNMPLGAELPAVIGMHLTTDNEAWWWGALVGKVVIGFYALITTVAVYAFGARFISRAAGVAAALVFVSTPWVGFVSMAGLIEGGSALYTMLMVYSLALWVRSNETDHGPLVLAGLTAGAAVAVKYPAVLFVAAPASVFVVGRMLLQRSFSTRGFAIFVCAGLLAGGVWMLKNVAYTGNPTYPLLYEVFGGESRTPAKHEQWTRAHRVPEGGVTASAFGKSLEMLAIDSRYATPLLVPFFFAGLVAGHRRRLLATLACYLAFVVLAWWLLTHRLERFLLPHLPIAAVIAGAGLVRASNLIWRCAILALLVAALLPNLLLISSQSVGDNRFLVGLDHLRRFAGQDAHIHPAHLWLNANVPSGYRAVVCGEAQVFNFRVPVEYNTCFDDCVLEQVLRDKSRQERADELRRRRISHIMVYWRELDRYREPGNYGYSEYVTRKRVREELVLQQRLLREIKLPIEPENCQVFEVVGWRDWE